MLSKPELRRTMTEFRKLMSRAAQKQAAQALATMLARIFQPQQSYVIGLYAGMGGELSLDDVMRDLSKAGHSIALPRVDKMAQPPAMSFHHWQIGSPLCTGAFGIAEPDGDRINPQIMFLPLLAFDRLGARLGRGGGFYDRYLEQIRRMQSICAIGVAFDEQEVEKCPTESHDQPLDAIVTPSKLISIHADKLATFGFVAE
jgi:5-formyltetrahydrofolate cyclo-ligase